MDENPQLTALTSSRHPVRLSRKATGLSNWTTSGSIATAFTSQLSEDMLNTGGGRWVAALGAPHGPHYCHGSTRTVHFPIYIAHCNSGK